MAHMSLSQSSPSSSDMNKNQGYGTIPSSVIDLLPAPKPTLSPLPFTWRCHVCYRTQRLSVGPRCLHCSHTMCSPPRPGCPRTNNAAGPGRTRKKKPAPRRQKGFCLTSFDYGAWRAHNVFCRAWRKFDSNPARYGPKYSLWMSKWDSGNMLDRFEVESEWEASIQRDEIRRLNRIKRAEWSCERDCDYPAECVRVRAAALSHPVDEDGDDAEEATDEDGCKQPSPAGNTMDGNEDETALCF